MLPSSLLGRTGQSLRWDSGGLLRHPHRKCPGRLLPGESWSGSGELPGFGDREGASR